MRGYSNLKQFSGSPLKVPGRKGAGLLSELPRRVLLGNSARSNKIIEDATYRTTLRRAPANDIPSPCLGTDRCVIIST